MSIIINDLRNAAVNGCPICDVAADEIKVLEQSNERAKLCMSACEGIPDYQLVGEDGSPNKLGDIIDNLRATAEALAARVNEL